MSRTREIVRELRGVFRSSASKHEAHRVSRALLEQMSREPVVLSEILESFVRTRGSLEKRNYPVVALPVVVDAHFAMVANCWIPLPTGDTTLSTKAIHHHGDMLLSTVTAFGPGYEHWMFSPPKVRDRADELFSMDLLEAAPHPMHHVAFVDNDTPHCPLYPASLSITYALWSSKRRTTWLDTVKRLPGVASHATELRRAALKLGLGRALDVKVVEYFDFYPTASGFRGMRERQEFALGSNEDHLHSVFHILQQTGNEQLSGTIRPRMSSLAPASKAVATSLLDALGRGSPVSGRLSPGHYDVPHANFAREVIQGALRASATTRDPHAGRFADSSSHQEAPAARTG